MKLQNIKKHFLVYSCNCQSHEWKISPNLVSNQQCQLTEYVFFPLITMVNTGIRFCFSSCGDAEAETSNGTNKHKTMVTWMSSAGIPCRQIWRQLVLYSSLCVSVCFSVSVTFPVLAMFSIPTPVSSRQITGVIKVFAHRLFSVFFLLLDLNMRV